MEKKSTQSIDDAKKRIERMIKRFKRMRPTNKDCPLSLDKPTPPVFRYVSPTGTVIAYSAAMLHQSMLTSGDFRDPTTRVPYTDAELSRLDRTLRRVDEYKHLPSVLNSKADSDHWKRVRLQREEFPWDLQQLRNDIESVVVLLLSMFVPIEAKETLLKCQDLVLAAILSQTRELAAINEIEVVEMINDIRRDMTIASTMESAIWVAIVLSLLDEIQRVARQRIRI